MKINSVIEPNHSFRKLKEFEEKYGFSSKYFYSNYKQDKNIIDDKYEAAEWAFEYEVNQKAKKSSKFEGNDE
jgi:hypothetical protein